VTDTPRGILVDWRMLATAGVVLLGGQGAVTSILTGEAPQVVVDEDVAALLDETEDQTELLDQLVRETRRARRCACEDIDAFFEGEELYP
jgi:hypothetical protein